MNKQKNNVTTILLLLFSVYVLSVTPVANIIDDFTADSPPLVIVVNSNTQFPTTIDEFTEVGGGHIIGDERDVSLTLQSGTVSSISKTGVANAEFYVSTLNNSSSSTLLQYDGTDSSINLNPKGLGGVNLTANNANAFNLTYNSDVATNMTITLYDMVGGLCTVNVIFNVSPNTNPEFLAVPMTLFVGSCDFTDIGAIEVDVSVGESGDFQLYGIYTVHFL